MKTLFLLRHAKSSWGDPVLEDQYRPLNERGLGDAPLMGARLLERGEAIDRIITSPAKRARHTAELLAEACRYPLQEIVEETVLYFTSTRSIEDLIVRQDDQIQSLMLVFHNPDITYFTNSIEGVDQIDNVPTCGLIKIACDIVSWNDWTAQDSRFLYFDYPKK